MGKPTKKPAVIEPAGAIVHEPPMTRLARTLRDTPLGNMFTEDLAAAREHGTATVRVGVAPDGNPVVYARDEATGRAIGEAIQKRTAVHALAIPPITVEQYDVLARGAAEKLMPGAPAPVALPAAAPRRAGAFRVEVRDADGEEIAASDGPPNVTSAVRWAKEWNDDEGDRGFRARLLVLRGDLFVHECARRRSAGQRPA
jgi:hypothetical protein